MAEIIDLRRTQEDLARACGLTLSSETFVFSFEPGCEAPPHPDNISHAFADIPEKAMVGSDNHLQSLRPFHATQIGSVISEAQKQVGPGWSTVQMAGHYTDGVPKEDRRAGAHRGWLLSARAVNGRAKKRQTADHGHAKKTTGKMERTAQAPSPR